MKTSNLLIFGAVGIGLALLLSKSSSGSNGGGQGGLIDASDPIIKKIADTGMISKDPSLRQSAYDLANTPINTPESIKAGIGVINTGGSIRTSQTLKQLGNNTNIAQIGSRVAVVSVKEAPRDLQGQTNFDRIIAQNFANKK